MYIPIYLICIVILFFTHTPTKCKLEPIPAYTTSNLQQVIDSIQYDKLYQKAIQCKIFCEKNKYNTDFCLLINLSKHSGLKRFYVWDFNKNIAIDSGMVSHGCNFNPWGQTYSKEKAVCSNTENSHASSIGNYRIGERGSSQWGIKIKYTLYGLDSTNNNAFKRYIVLHSWDDVSEEEVYPEGTPEGWGCPATSNNFLQRIDLKLHTSKQQVLLTIFE